MKNIRQTKIFNILTQSYLTKAFSLFSLAQAMNAVVGFGLLALYAKYLPPAEFGKISLIWMFVLIASILIDCRLNTSFSIRFYKVSKEENTKNIYSIFAYNIIIWGIVFLNFLLFPSLFQRMLGFGISNADLVVSFFLILFMILGNFYTNILIVAQKPKHFFLAKLTFNAVLIITTIIYLVVLKSGYIAYLKSYLAAYFIIALIGTRFFISNYRLHKKALSLSKLKELLKIGLPLVPAGLLLMLLTWADRYILNLYAGLAIVGIYTLGYRFAEVINSFIINPFGQALSPLVFKQFAQSRNKYKDTLSRVLKYYWLVMFGIMIGYFVVLREVFQFLIAPEYMEGYNIVGIVLLGVILWGATNFLGSTVVVAEKTGKMFLFTSVSVALNIGFNFLLIPKYGMYGAAVATLIAYAVQFAMIFVYTQKLVFINYDYAFIIKSIVFSLCFFVSILFLSYLKVNTGVSLGLKIILFSLFILLSYKFLGLEKLIKGILNYGVVPKQTIG